ncbi:MAG: hypothetical protein HYT65_03540 [Candidatus Yanofskybacteria bacterium]|nr:hypothetical protein [Candidatus Yanofskybacteria bacterium]
MQFKLPKDSDKYRWTNHVKDKMLYYGISEGLIKRIVRFPKRKEDGVAPKTIAVMQPTSSKKQEIWVMYQLRRQQGPESYTYGKAVSSEEKKTIISAWRYPGVSPVGKKIPIPEEILQELNDLIE